MTHAEQQDEFLLLDASGCINRGQEQWAIKW